MQGSINDVLRSKGNKVYWVSADSTVNEAVQAMNIHSIGAVLVANEGVAVGIFTERDVMRRVVGEGRLPGDTKVSEVMSEKLLAVRPEMDVGEALRLLTERRHRHLPVVQDGALLGMVSSGDLTRWLTKDLEQEVADLYSYINGPSVRVPPRSSQPPMIAMPATAVDSSAEL